MVSSKYSWLKRNEKQWDLFIDGEPAGYVVKVVFKNGQIAYQGIAFNKKTRKNSNPVSSKDRRICKNAVVEKAKPLFGIR